MNSIRCLQYFFERQYSKFKLFFLSENDVDGDVLLSLDENQLQSLGISLGQRVKLVRYIKSLLSMGSSNSTEQDKAILHHFESPSGTITHETQLLESQFVIEKLPTSVNNQLVDGHHQMEDLLGSSTSRDPLPFSSKELIGHVPTSSDSNSQNHVPQKVCEKVYGLLLSLYP